jgi:sn-glycerol 3-phosphate transport system permease protein
MSAQVAPTYRTLHSSPYQTLPLATKAGTYFLLVLASLVVLFPLLFAFSLAIQGATIAPTLIPDVSKLDLSVFAQAFSKEKHLGRWILNSFVVSVAVTLGQLLTSALAAYALANLRFSAKPFFSLPSWGP